MSTFGYHSELKKYEEVDEDQLLACLSSEELQELERELADLDPDDDVPIGLRQKDQTAKTQTQNFDRDALLKHWEEEAQRLLDHDKQESGRAQEEEESRGKQETATRKLDNDRKNNTNNKTQRGVGARNDVKDREVEKKDETKKVPLRGKCPLKKSQNKESRSESSAQILTPPPDRPSGNPIVIDEALEQILRDDPAMSEVNLNNIEDISAETLLRFAEALSSNTHVRVFSLANTHADDRVAFAMSKMLRQNCSIQNLNIESNFVSGQGILALVAALKDNRTLVELRFHNQRHMCGGKVEMEMVQLLRENTTLLKLGYQFDLPGPRMTATGILTRNQDQQRQKRLQQKKDQSPPDLPASGLSAEKRPAQRKPSEPSKTENRRPPPPPPPPAIDPPTRKIADMVKHHEGSNGTKVQSNQKKPKCKKLKNGANEKESADILKELKNALKPALHKKQIQTSRALPPPQRSGRDDLMAAIRGSSIRSLKRVDPSQT